MFPDPASLLTEHLHLGGTEFTQLGVPACAGYLGHPFKNPRLSAE